MFVLATQFLITSSPFLVILKLDVLQTHASHINKLWKIQRSLSNTAWKTSNVSEEWSRRRIPELQCFHIWAGLCIYNKHSSGLVTLTPLHWVLPLAVQNNQTCALHSHHNKETSQETLSQTLLRGQCITHLSSFFIKSKTKVTCGKANKRKK